jgi:outer membrane protein TolC
MKNLIFLFFVGLYPAQQTWNLQQCLDYASTHHPLVKQATVNVSKNEKLITGSKGMLLPSVEAGVRHTYSFGLLSISPVTRGRRSILSMTSSMPRQTEPVQLEKYSGHFFV